MRQMRHVKPHSKAVCLLAPPCAHMVTARFGQSDRPRLNKSRIRRRRKKALAPCENTGKFPQNTRRNALKTHDGAQLKNFKSPLLRRFIYSLLFKANGTRVMLGGHKKYSKSVVRLSCAVSFTRYFSRRTVRALCSADTNKYSKSVMRLSIQSENKRKITLTRKTIKSAIRTSNIARTTMI